MTRPRPDQIAELTRGMELPLAPVEALHLEIIAEGFAMAFSDLQKVSAATVSTGSEAEVNALMETRLNALVEENPLWNQLVLCVARGKESLSYNGSHLEKRPDLSLYLTNRSRAFPLVTECKLIDAASGKDEALYCARGLSRFLLGDYAWGSREAFMLAYVRDDSSISSRLMPYLHGKGADLAVVEPPRKHERNGLDLAQSRHDRIFTYLGQSSPGVKPGPIAIWHLWLPSTPA